MMGTPDSPTPMRAPTAFGLLQAQLGDVDDAVIEHEEKLEALRQYRGQIAQALHELTDVDLKLEAAEADTIERGLSED